METMPFPIANKQTNKQSKAKTPNKHKQNPETPDNFNQASKIIV